MKRLFDFLAASIGLACAAPLLAVLLVLIRLQSNGAAIFAQTRVGRGMAPFTCYKLRTMYSGTDQRPTHEVSLSSVTPIGAILRRTKLDELPQLINVLRGDMSLVGPRPCLPSQAELIDARQNENVFSVRPGITGLAQVLDVDMADAKKLAGIDGEYVRTHSFIGDLKLILATLVGSGRGVDRTKVGSMPQKPQE